MNGTAIAADVRSKFNPWPTSQVVEQPGLSATG